MSPSYILNVTLHACFFVKLILKENKHNQALNDGKQVLTEDTGDTFGNVYYMIYNFCYRHLIDNLPMLGRKFTN